MTRTMTLSMLLAFVLSNSNGFAQQLKKGETQHKEAPLKSVHLLNLPEGVSESQLTAAFNDVNRAIGKAGYPDAGYRLWKLQLSKTGDEDAEYKYQYLWEGNWPSQAAYDAIHSHTAYQAAWKPYSQLIEKLDPQQLYIRYAEVSAMRTKVE